MNKELCCLIDAYMTCTACQETWCSYHLDRIESNYAPAPVEHYISCLGTGKSYYFCPTKQCLISSSNGKFIIAKTLGDRSQSLEYLLFKENKNEVNV